MTPDPIGLAGGVNRYAYVQNNPVNYFDPLGLRRGGILIPIRNLIKHNSGPSDILGPIIDGISGINIPKSPWEAFLLVLLPVELEPGLRYEPAPHDPTIPLIYSPLDYFKVPEDNEALKQCPF